MNIVDATVVFNVKFSHIIKLIYIYVKANTFLSFIVGELLSIFQC